MKKYIYSICFSSVLAAFTLFVVLDTFVISRPMEYVHEQINTSMFSKSQSGSIADDITNDTDSAKTDSADTSDLQSDSTTGTSEEENSDSSEKSSISDGAELIGEYQNDQASIRLYKY